MKLIEHWKTMSSYEKAKIVVDTSRVVATLLVPFLIIGLGYFTKHYLRW